MQVQQDLLEDDGVALLLQEHRNEMLSLSPKACVHALDPSTLKRDDLSFWSVRVDSKVIACGGLKRLDGGIAEIKSMRVSTTHRGTGIARRVLRHILDHAVAHGISGIYLETGTNAFFEPAISLYVSEGFSESGPFSDYAENDHSRFFFKDLAV